MPRKIRPAKRRRDLNAIRPAVAHFLETGEIVLMPGDNPWMGVSLMGAAASEARAAWLDGDEAGARAALARCPASYRLFLGRGGDDAA